MRPSVRNKTQAQENKPLTHAKNKCALSVERASVWSEKHLAHRKKEGGWAAREGKSLLVEPKGLFSPQAGGSPRLRPTGNRAPVRPKKQAQENTPLTQENRNNKFALCFFKRQSDVKLAIKFTFP